MVLPAVLRDPAQHSEQACRRGRDVLGDPGAGVPAVARYREDEIVQISPAGEAVLLDLRHRLRAAGLAWRQAARRHLRECRARPDLLLLRLFPDPAAAAEPDRKAEDDSEFDRRRRAGENRRPGDTDGVDGDRAYGCRRAVRGKRAERPGRGSSGHAAIAEMVVLRSVWHV